MAIFFVLVEEMSWFDSHCHLQGFWEKGDLDETLDRAKEMGVRKMTTVGTSREDWKLYRTLAAEYSGRVFFSAGLHPSYVEICKNHEDFCSLILATAKVTSVPFCCD